MSDAVAQAVAWLNAVADAVGRYVLAPIGLLPGWLSATIVAAVTGLALLVAFKYTSNQRAIRRVRSDVKANLLALKLFKESTAVALRAQGRILLGALRLALLAVMPMGLISASTASSQRGLAPVAGRLERRRGNRRGTARR